MDSGHEPTFEIAGLLAPSAKHDWLMAGEYRSGAGAVRQLVIYSTSPGRDWAMVAYSGETAPDSEVVTIAAMPDGGAAIFGAIDGEGGHHPAMWVFDGVALSEPSMIGDPTVPGRIAAATVDAAGTVHAVIELRDKDGRRSVVAGHQAPGAAWVSAELPTGRSELRVHGIAASGTTVVVSGESRDVAATDPVFRSSGYVSDDGGTTFAAIDTTAFHDRDFPTAWGPVVVSSDGMFHVATCTAFSGFYASSLDGHTWTSYSDREISELVGPTKAQCVSIAVDPLGGVWIVRYAGDLAAFRMEGSTITDAVIVAAPERDFFTSQYVDSDRSAVVADGSEVALVGGLFGGVRGGVRGTQFETPEIRAIEGAPSRGIETFDGYNVVNRSGDLVELLTFPTTIDGPNGRWYLTNGRELRDLGFGGSLTPSADTLAVGPAEGDSAEVAIDLAWGEVAFGSMLPEAPDARGGTVGDLGVARRVPGGSWSPLERQSLGDVPYVSDVTAVGDVAFAVGGEFRGNLLLPLVVAADATEFRRLSVAPIELAEYLVGVCPLPSGELVAVGTRVEQRPFVALIDPVDETVSWPTPTIEADVMGFVDCASADDGVLVVADSFTGPRLYSTADGVEFSPVTVLGPFDEPAVTSSGGSGVAVVGATGATGGDGFVAFGASISELAPVPVPSMRGPGSQEAMDVVVRDGEVLVLGAVNGAPIVWPIRVAVPS